MGEVAIELRGVEAQRPAALRRVAGEAFAAAGIAPDLRARDAAVVDDEVFVQSRLGHQQCVGEGVAPAIGHAIHAVGIPHEQARLQPARGGGDAVGEFEVEVFHPRHAGG